MAYPYDDLPAVTADTECDEDWANDSVVTPLNELKDELGDNPRGSAASVEARLDTEHADDGTHSGEIALAASDVPVLDDYLKVDGSDVMEGDLDLGLNALVGTSYEAKLGSTTVAPVVPSMTTTQRNALSPALGMIIYNSSNTKFEGYGPTSWRGIGLNT